MLANRWRHNPGFIAAAAAGSIGLVLAFVLGLQGAWRFLDGEPADDDLLYGSAPITLGDPDDGLGSRRDLDPDPLEEIESVALNQSAARRKVSVLGGDDPDDDPFAEIEAAPAEKATAERKERTANRDPFEMNEEEDDEEVGVSARPRAHRAVAEDPWADDDGPPRKAVSFPADVEDRTDDGSDEAEPETIAATADDSEREPQKSASGPRFDSEARDDEVTEETEAEVAAGPTHSSPPATSAATEPALGWKTPPSRPKLPAAPDSPIAKKSRAVETVIVATPQDADQPARVERTAAEDNAVAPSRLTLEIAGPGSARIGETCNFEIRVRNPGRAAVEKIVLSVELPPELAHAVAPAVEQKIASIAPGETYRALLRTRAKASGAGTLKSDIAIQGRIDARASAKIEIGGRAALGSGAGRAARR
jgi:hypothetical protein